MMIGNGSSATIRVGIVGSGVRADRIAPLYRNLPGAQLVALCTEDAAADGVSSEIKVFSDLAEMLEKAGLDALEIHSGSKRRREAVEHAAARGMPVGIHTPLAASLEETDAVVSAVRKAGVKVLLMDPLLFHPFISKAKKLLEDGQVGEIQMVRIKSQAGGAGGSGSLLDPKQMLDPDFNLLLTPPFDKIMLAERLVGPIAQVYAYKGSAARMVSYKFEAPGRYGVHEAVYSPDLYVHGDGPPVDDSIEITGTDGILWLRNLSAVMVEAPKLMLKRKNTVTVWDDRVECGYDRVWAAVRGHFLDCVRGKATPCVDVEAGRRAAAVNLAAQISIDESRPVRVADVLS
ncbi:MAG: gfo/Idh/MocA family oxidoreductase [Myxococcales bacterium]|nr:MAG: gfo/Idh/MocA family oxidoreductase [Myxococcales bacterium]